MTVTITHLWLFLAVQVVIALGVLFWPDSKYNTHDPYGIGSLIDGVFRLAGGVFATLVLWLVYFVLLAKGIIVS